MFELRPYQAEAKQAILTEWEEGHRKTLLVLPTGCHTSGSYLLLADGSKKKVDDIHVGDRLLGPDGQPRNVLYEQSGLGKLYLIIPVKGKPFAVTGDHQLTLIRTNEYADGRYPCERRGGEVIDVSVNTWMNWSDNQKHLYKLLRCSGIEKFPDMPNYIPYMIDPYFLGILLGDGSIRSCTCVTTMDEEVVKEIYSQAEKYQMNIRVERAGQANTYYLAGNPASNRQNFICKELKLMGLYGCNAFEKFVPKSYLCGNMQTRLDLIAGLLDTDGSAAGNGYDFITASEQLANDLAFMCRSVGLAAYVNSCRKKCQGAHEGTYYRVSVSGNCDMIPCRVEHKKVSKRTQKKDVLRTGFDITPIGQGQYFGFTVDGDNRYLMDDFTITHNCGKTIVFAAVTENQVEQGHRVLVMSHRGELLSQAANKLREASGLDSVLEKADSTSLGSNIPVTVGSVQSLAQERRLAKFPNDYFSDIIVDEAHHCLSDSYQRVLDHFPDANVLGVTATPDRGDMQNLGEYFDTKAYEYTMPEAIREGYLCPIKAQMIPLKLDIGDVSISGGDYAVGKIGSALEPYLHQIAIEMTHYCKGRKTVVFLPLIATSQKFCRMLNEVGLSAAEVNGNSDDRSEVLADFEAGKYEVLCNSMLLTEGWDCPSVDCIVILQPTKVRSLYQQMVGRGMRLAPGKENLLLLDFLWMTERHDLCRPSALISKDETIAKKIDERMVADEDGIDLIEAEEQAERDVLAEREANLAQQLSEMRGKKRKLVDPLQYALSIAAEDLTNYTPTFAWEMAPPSRKQLEFLERRGIYANSVENAGYASMLIDKLVRRQDEGLATPKQIRCLEKYGFRHVGTWQFDDAGALISRLADNHWKLPYGMNPALYTP